MENTGQIIRSKKTGKSRFTPVSNDILQSKVLTCEEKSILVHLLSLPEDWVVYKTLIWQDMNIGRGRFNTAWIGLVDKGYIISVRVIDTNTNLVRGWNHMVVEEPVLSDHSEIPLSDLPKFGVSENGGINKVITEQSNNLQNNKNTNKDMCDLDFEELWKLYPRHENKKLAKDRYKRLPINTQTIVKEHLTRFVDFVKREKTEHRFIPHLATYLSKERYLDAINPQSVENKGSWLDQFR
jgi:hypothetical protein